MKIASGGPAALVAFLGTLVMTTWSRGRAITSEWESDIPDLDIFLNDIRQRKPQRVAGTSVFLTENASRVPRAFLLLLHRFWNNLAGRTSAMTVRTLQTRLNGIASFEGPGV